MARKAIFTRLGAGVITGTIALLHCKNVPQDDEQHQPRLRSLPTPRTTTSSTPGAAHGKAESEIRRCPIALQQKVSSYSTRIRFGLSPTQEDAGSSQPKLVEIRDAITEINPSTTRNSRSQKNTTATTSDVDRPGSYVIENQNEVTIEGTVVQGPTRIPDVVNAARLPRLLRLPPLETISGIADRFTSEVFQAVNDVTIHLQIPPLPLALADISPVQTSTALVPVRRTTRQAYTIDHLPTFSVTPRARAINADLVFALLADGSVIRPSLFVPHTSQTDTLVIIPPACDSLIVSTPATSFIYSPRRSITYDAEIPTAIAGAQIDMVPVVSLSKLDGQTTEQKSSPVLVDSATQTEDFEQQTALQTAPTEDLPAESVDSPRCSSDRQSLLESRGSSKQDSPATSRSISPPQFSYEAELAYHQEEIDRLNSLVRHLNDSAEDHETTENALAENIEQVEREKAELWEDIDILRSQLAHLSRDVKEQNAEAIAVYERTRKVNVEDFNNAVEAYEARAVAMYEKMLWMKDMLVKSYATDDKDEKVLTLLTTMHAIERENKALRDQVREQILRLRVLPEIERHVKQVIRERDTFKAQRDNLRVERDDLQAELYSYRACYRPPYNPLPNPYQRRS